MSNSTIGLVIGGLLPALLFGLSGVFAKPASVTGIGLGWYLTSIGCAILLTGLALHLLQPSNPFSLRGSLFAAAVGFSWAPGAALVALALSSYGMAIARIVPLYNMNTLVAVLIGLTVFAEWKEVQVVKLLAGAALITLGGRLVATA